MSLLYDAIGYCLAFIRQLWNATVSNMLLGLPAAVMIIYWVRYLFRKIRKLLF